MASYFLDSSALVKRYVAETGSGWISGLLDPSAANRIFIASIAGAEVVAALARRKTGTAVVTSRLSQGIAEFRADFVNRFYLVELQLPLILNAMDLAERHSLRGYDSVQLAAAIAVNIECVAAGTRCMFVCSDIQLNHAAATEGLTVANPNSHP